MNNFRLPALSRPVHISIAGGHHKMSDYSLILTPSSLPFCSLSLKGVGAEGYYGKELA